MNYLDTSVLTAVVLHDPESKDVEHALLNADEEILCLSLWTGVEVFSAISRRLRTRQISAKIADQARSFYLLEFQDKHLLLPVTVADFDRALSLLQNVASGLRSGDALHLAIALNRGAHSLWTLDKILRKVARAEGIESPSI